jgi:hypothetical protein
MSSRLACPWPRSPSKNNLLERLESAARSTTCVRSRSTFAWPSLPPRPAGDIKLANTAVKRPRSSSWEQTAHGQRRMRLAWINAVTRVSIHLLLPCLFFHYRTFYTHCFQSFTNTTLQSRSSATAAIETSTRSSIPWTLMMDVSGTI